MPFWKRNSGSQVKRLVEEENYDEIGALASRDPDTGMQLVGLLQDPEEEVRETAAYGLASIGKNDNRVPDTIKAVMPELITLFEHPEAEVRRVAANAVVGIAWNWLMWEDFGEIVSQALAPMTGLLDDADAKVRAKATEAIKVLAEWAEDKGDVSRLANAVPQLVRYLSDPLKDLRAEAIWALRAIAHRRPDLVATSGKAVAGLLEDSDDHICLGTCLTLIYLAESHVESVKPGEAHLLALLEGPDRWGGLANDYAAIVLGFIAADSPPLRDFIAPRLIECLKNNRGIVRERAARALGRVGESNPELVAPAAPLLEEMVQSQDEDLRLAAVEALNRIQQ